MTDSATRRALYPAVWLTHWNYGGSESRNLSYQESTKVGQLHLGRERQFRHSGCCLRPLFCQPLDRLVLCLRARVHQLVVGPERHLATRAGEPCVARPAVRCSPRRGVRPGPRPPAPVPSDGPVPCRTPAYAVPRPFRPTCVRSSLGSLWAPSASTGRGECVPPIPRKDPVVLSDRPA